MDTYWVFSPGLWSLSLLCAMIWPEPEGQNETLCTGHKRQERVTYFMPGVLFMYLYQNIEISYYRNDYALCLTSDVTHSLGSTQWLISASGDCLAGSLEMEIKWNCTKGFFKWFKYCCITHCQAVPARLIAALWLILDNHWLASFNKSL